MKPIAVEGQVRTETGKKSTKAVRRSGNIPCVLYGGKDTVHFETASNNLKPLIYTHNFHTVDVQLNGNSYNAVIKEIQFHPVTDVVTHVDFLELVPGKLINTELPVSLVGQAVGAKEGGKLLLKMRKLKVKAMPKDLVEEVEVDVTHLEVGKSVRVQDVNLPGVEIMHSPASPIASVEITRALRSAAAAEDGVEVEGEEVAEETEE